MRRRLPPPWKPSRATGRWRFLADASAALDASIDYDETLANTVRLAFRKSRTTVSSFGWAKTAPAVGSFGHRDPRKQALLERIGEYVPPIVSSQHPVSRAIQTGRPQLVTDVGRDLTKWWDGSRLSIARALAPCRPSPCP